jgi:hypothetical protein
VAVLPQGGGGLGVPEALLRVKELAICDEDGCQGVP